MANPVSQPAPAAWRADLQADFLAYQLLRMARAALSDHFDDDPVEQEYSAALRRELGRKRGGRSWLLQDWDDHPEHGKLRLVAQPDANVFSLNVTHAAFHRGPERHL